MNQVINVTINPPKVINVTMTVATPQIVVQAFQSTLGYRVTIGPTPPDNPAQNDIWIQV